MFSIHCIHIPQHRACPTNHSAMTAFWRTESSKIGRVPLGPNTRSNKRGLPTAWIYRTINNPNQQLKICFPRCARRQQYRENTHYSSQIPSNGATAAQVTHPYVLARLFSELWLDGSLTKQKSPTPKHTSTAGVPNRFEATTIFQVPQTSRERLKK